MKGLVPAWRGRSVREEMEILSLDLKGERKKLAMNISIQSKS